MVNGDKCRVVNDDKCIVVNGDKCIVVNGDKCIVVSLACSNLQPHNSVIPVTRWLMSIVRPM